MGLSTRSRRMQNDDDVRAIRRLLAETYAHTPLGFNWDVRRWDGQRYYDADPSLDAAWLEQVQMWELFEGESASGQVIGKVIGALYAEGAPQAQNAAATDGTAQTIQVELHLFIDPAWRNLEPEMFAWAEARVWGDTSTGGIPLNLGTFVLATFVWDSDGQRQAYVSSRGYRQTGQTGVIRRLKFDGRQWPTRQPAPGYHLRTTQAEDAQGIADLLNAAFGRTFHNAQEYLNFTRLAPSFDPDLDLVAIAPDGTIGAYVGIPFDADNRRGIFEPVCTHPQHRRLGLAQWLMIEGLHRLQAIGAVDVTVETGDAVAANRLYDSLGFTEVARGSVWHKTR